MDILILGGTGQVGAPIAKALIAQGHQVSVTGRKQPSKILLTGRFIRFVPGVTEWSDLPHCDVLINCIGIIAEDRHHTFEQIHFKMVQEILDCQEALGFEYFIQISALGADVEHPSRFLSSKGRADRLIQQKLSHYAIIRPSIVCTPGTALVQNLYILIRTFGKYWGVIPLVGNGQTKVQPILINDLVEAIARIVNQQPQGLTLNAVGPQAYSITSVLHLMEKALDISAKHLPMPLSLLYSFAWLIEKINPVFFSREHLLMLATDNISSPTPLETLLAKPLQSAEAFFSNPHNYIRKTNTGHLF